MPYQYYALRNTPRDFCSGQNQIQLFGPKEEGFCRDLPLLVGLRALKAMKHLITVIDPRVATVIAQKSHGIAKRAHRPSVTDMKLWMKEIFAGFRHKRLAVALLAVCFA